MAHQLHTLCQENTYLDIGSTLDPLLFGSAGFSRRYLRGQDTRENVYLEVKNCVAFVVSEVA
jgi:hypothetical protein